MKKSLVILIISFVFILGVNAFAATPSPKPKATTKPKVSATPKVTAKPTATPRPTPTPTPEPPKYFYDNAWHYYTAKPVKLIVQDKEITFDVPPIIIEGRVMVPARAVFQALNGVVKWDNNTKEVAVYVGDSEVKMTAEKKQASVNRNLVDISDVTAKIISDRMMVPVRFISEKVGLMVSWNDKDRVVNISIPPQGLPKVPKANINDISYTPLSDIDRITIKSDLAITSFTRFTLADPNRVGVDIADANLTYLHDDLAIGNSIIEKIRFAQYDVAPKIVRIVVDLNSLVNSNIYLSDNKKELYIDFPVKRTVIKSMSFSKTSYNENLDIVMVNPIMPNAYRLDSEDRIVLDFNSALLDSNLNAITSAGDLIKAVHANQFNLKTARVVLNVYSQPSYDVSSITNGIRISVSIPNYKNIVYSNASESKFTLLGDTLPDSINQTIDASKTKFTLNLPSQNYGEGILKINDGVVNYAELKKSQDANITFLSVYTKQNNQFEFKNNILTISKDIDTKVSTVLDPRAIGKLVAIDPGHGGSDTGAIGVENGVTVLYEKDVNLDISLRINAILKKAGVSTYMTRTEDVAVDLAERPQKANLLRASLFLCVHNNAAGNTSVGGTMVLYNPYESDGFTVNSNRFGRIALDDMMANLGLDFRGLLSSPEMLVLNQTKMPAIITESAFLTNKRDRDLLKTDEFKQKIAKSLSESVIKTLNEMVK